MPTLAISKLLLIDIVFLALLFVVAGILAKSKRAAYAVLKRNFLGYFSNPTGYVFLCLFVLLTSMAAFWPHEFFSSNLATLGQLNKWFPIIMLFFIPAITMSIWADERRQGTDELLLTLPADDFDIVIGKFLASASIYTASLIFSQVSTFLVLVILSKGNLDTWLFVSNYLGYWFIGLAMLAIGMIASFLTSNLTVGFILGALFNAPLAFAAMADVIVPQRALARFVSLFSIEEQFDNFGRGVVSISSIAYFSLLVVFGLYFCMVLIGKRHWSGGRDGNGMFMHYLVRTLLLVVIVFAASYFFRNNDSRFDTTEGQVSSLSPTTRQLIRDLKPERPIVIDAFLSADVPEQFAKTKYDLVSLLKEFQSLASSRKIPLQVRINDDLEPFSDEAALAEKQYGIQPQMVRVRERGAYTDQKVMLGAAFRCGLQKIVVPFFENGIPVEYELVRSINTVAQPKRKKLGVVRTDAQFMGGFSMAGGGFQQLPRQPIIEELEKQFELEEIDPSTPISTDRADVLMVVQPSSLGPQELTNLVEAVKAGVPTAIFEDPFPFGFQRAFPGTGEPKQAPGGQFGGGGPMPKGDIQELWKALGLNIPKQIGMDGVSPDVVWQQYNPYPKLRYITNASDEWVFVREEAEGAEDALSQASPITAGLRELMFLYSGAVQKDDRDDLKITNLVTTGTQAGTIKFSDVQMQFQRGEASTSQLQVLQGPPTGRQTLAVLVEGKESPNAAGDATSKDKAEAEKAGEKKSDAEKDSGDEKKADDSGAKSGDTPSSPAPRSRPIRAVYIADTDCMLPIFIDIRKRPEQFEEINFRFQNVTFVLNVIDVLAGETGYPEIRRHEPQHSTLQLVEEQADTYRQEELERQREFQKEFNEAIQEAEGENRKSIAEFEEKLQKLQKEGPTDVRKRQELISMMQQMQQSQAVLERKLSVKREGLEMERNKRTEASRRQADLEVLRLQNTYKMLAIFLPPIPPLLVGIAVFVSRRVKEREGISKNRLV